MKRLLFIIIILLSLFLIKIPKYTELNHLIIIESIGVDCNNNKTTIYFKEIIPTKNDNDINYKYKIYQKTNSNIDLAYKELKEKIKNKIYLRKTKYLITNCSNNNIIIDYFNIKPKTIKKNNIKKELKNN